MDYNGLIFESFGSSHWHLVIWLLEFEVKPLKNVLVLHFFNMALGENFKQFDLKKVGFIIRKLVLL